MIPEELNPDVLYAAHKDDEADEAMHQWLDENPERDADDYTEWYLLTGGR